MPIVDPFEQGTPKPSPRARQRDLQMESTRQSILTEPLQRAKIASDLAKAPVDTARASVALDVDQRTKEATIRKEIANADDAEYTAQINKLKSKYPQLTAEQTLAAARAMLMAEGEKAYSSAKGYDPGSLRNLAAGALGAIPMAGDTIASFVRDPESQLAVSGQKQFTEGATRSLTGAGLRGDERSFAASEFFPMPGESDAVKRQKKALRTKYLSQIIQAAGPALAADLTAKAAAADAQDASTGLPKGFKFLGEAKGH